MLLSRLINGPAQGQHPAPNWTFRKKGKVRVSSAGLPLLLYDVLFFGGCFGSIFFTYMVIFVKIFRVVLLVIEQLNRM